MLKQRPQQFESVKSAVAWAVSSGMSRTHDAAEVSLPTQLRPVTPPGTGYQPSPPSALPFCQVDRAVSRRCRRPRSRRSVLGPGESSPVRVALLSVRAPSESVD